MIRGLWIYLTCVKIHENEMKLFLWREKPKKYNGDNVFRTPYNNLQFVKTATTEMHLYNSFQILYFGIISKQFDNRYAIDSDFILTFKSKFHKLDQNWSSFFVLSYNKILATHVSCIEYPSNWLLNHHLNNFLN